MRILVVEDKIKMARLIQRGLFSFSELLARLRALARRDPGEVLSRFHLLEQAWDQAEHRPGCVSGGVSSP